MEQRRELKKDPITRQLIDEEIGDDEFFTVQVKLEGTNTGQWYDAASCGGRGAAIGSASAGKCMINLGLTQRTRV